MQDNATNISVLRFAVAVAVTLMVLFAICWLAIFLPVGNATHAYIGLFTTADPRTGIALAQGLCWSLVFGFIAGGLGAFVYNLVGGRGRA
jgi:hypothetical protein